MIRIQQLKLPCGHEKEELKQAVLHALSIREKDLISYKIKKRSLDARKKPVLFYSYVIDAKVVCEAKVLKRKKAGISAVEPKPYQYPAFGEEPLKGRPVIAGTGPAGLFCGLVLARCGFRPILLERGEDVESRQKKVDTFWKTGILDPTSNVQFGEGGAGTFSDGKLNTAVKDVSGRNTYVLQTFVEAGAPEEILYLNKPHIGTDVLKNVVKWIREEICRLGGEVRFKSQVTDLKIKDGALAGIIVNDTEQMECQTLVLAVGHSARDTFEMLAKKPVLMEQKAFAVGVRIEHPQSMIDVSQYGQERRDLPAADYKLTRNLKNGRGVYSFCMCPGGYVVNAILRRRTSGSERHELPCQRWKKCQQCNGGYGITGGFWIGACAGRHGISTEAGRKGLSGSRRKDSGGASGRFLQRRERRNFSDTGRSGTAEPGVVGICRCAQLLSKRPCQIPC